MSVTISAALAAHYAGSTHTLATLWKVTLDSGTVYGFTNHDVDITYLGTTYRAATGFSPTDVASASDLSVDNLDVQGVLTSPAITEADLHAGVWDFAAVVVMEVNWADLTMGHRPIRTGHIGEVSIDRGTFRAELRGMMQAYSRTLGELTSAGCRAQLGDSRCTVNLTPFTVTGTIDAVNADGVTLYDAARTELGPTGGIAIVGITNANPGVVSMAASTNLFDGLAVVLSGIVGPAALNTTTIIRNLDSTHNHFDLGIDTSSTAAYPAYTSGGTVTPLGSDTGYFDFGVMTMTSGLNNGLSREVAVYTVGQIMLALPFPYDVAIGDTYSLIAGCDKSLNTCKTRFSNVINMQAEPYTPGLDKVIQYGKQ